MSLPRLKELSISDHDRAVVGLTYVYPVVSRRSGGVSVGINLSPNNACNWRCIYCQVPDLKRGTAPVVDFQKLEHELRSFLDELSCGNFLDQAVPSNLRRVNDIAFSGNGEPTSAPEFDRVVDLVTHVMGDFDLLNEIKLVLITNGSLMSRASVQRGLRRMAQVNGEVWFKLDTATREGIRRINNTRVSVDKIAQYVRIAASLCPTWIQTCMFQIDSHPPSQEECEAYLDLLNQLHSQNVPLQGVLLYGIARPSLQPEAPSLGALSTQWMKSFKEQIESLGLPVRLSL